MAVEVSDRILEELTEAFRQKLYSIRMDGFTSGHRRALQRLVNRARPIAELHPRPSWVNAIKWGGFITQYRRGVEQLGAAPLITAPIAFAVPFVAQNGGGNGGNGENGGYEMPGSFWDRYRYWIIGGVVVVGIAGTAYALFGRD